MAAGDASGQYEPAGHAVQADAVAPKAPKNVPLPLRRNAPPRVLHLESQALPTGPQTDTDGTLGRELDGLVHQGD